MAPAPAHSKNADRMDTIVSLAKRRGFVFPSSEIYGGLRAVVGLRAARRRAQEQHQAAVVALDGAGPRRHRRPRLVGDPGPRGLGGVRPRRGVFVDPLTECQSCHKRFRADHLEEAYEAKHNRPPANGLADINCPNCGTKGAFTEPKMFNGLLRTYLGPVEDESGLAYLRPGDGAGHLHQLPQRPAVGPAQAAVRHRPDRQVVPQRDHAGQLHLPHPRVRADGDGVLRRARHGRELAPVLDRHPAGVVHRPGRQARTTCGCSSTPRRSCRTTRSAPSTSSTGSTSPAASGASSRASPTAPTSTSPRHSEASGTDLSYFDQATGERFTPYVIEPAVGVDRSLLVFLLDAYSEDEAPTGKGGVEKRTVLRLDPRLAPVKAAVLPLSRNERLSPAAKDLAATLRKRWNVEFDDAGAIGRRYRRQDEIGTPYCVTVDFETLDDQAVTDPRARLDDPAAGGAGPGGDLPAQQPRRRLTHAGFFRWRDPRSRRHPRNSTRLARQHDRQGLLRQLRRRSPGSRGNPPCSSTGARRCNVASQAARGATGGAAWESTSTMSRPQRKSGR